MNSNEAPIIEVVDLVRKFGDRTVLNDISFNVHRGETLVIMGGSGCGKSTLLRHMIGSMKPTSGSVKIFGEEIATMNEREIGRVRQRFGMLFQSGALLASLTVGENVALPLFQHTDKSPDEIEEIVEQKLQMVGLTGFEDLKPAEISGGMKKRVGLARALALDPELLFSDEPTSGLDPIMTAVVDQLTLKLAHGSHVTAVVVSHDMTSAFRIATRMIMLGHGFDSDPQLSRVNEILTMQDIVDPTERINLVYKRALEFMEKIVGKKEVFPKAQLEKVMNFPFDGFETRLKGGFQKNMFIFFETFWPEKFEVVNTKLAGLIYNGMREANELGFTTSVNVGYYLTLVFLLGHRFATDLQYPWLMKVLYDPELKDESYKAACLHFMARKYFEILLGNTVRENLNDRGN